MKKTGVLTTIITIILTLIIISLIYLYLIYPHLPAEPRQLKIKQNIKNLPDVSSEIKMFYPNMRFTHNNLTYSFESCNEEKQKKMKQAFLEISSRTPLTFTETIKENADIQIGCSDDYLEKEKNIFIAGEGGPSEILNSSWYPAILKGKIQLYDSKCDEPVVELHELLHVFGFDHINKTDYIMYPYVNCNFHLNQEYINILNNLYSVPAKPELHFDSLNAVKKGSYLDFDVWVANQGLTKATNVKLKISSNKGEIKSFNLQEIPFGLRKNIKVTNVKLPSRNIEQIQFKIITSENEYSKENNIAIATL